jgi:peptidoglycan/xylan/chitin deacetylase (PgdA/CDA1 family)
MNKSLKKYIAAAGNLLPYSWLAKSAEIPPVLPFYHVVTDEAAEYLNSYEVRTSKAFEKELDWLLKHYQAVSLETLITSPGKRKMHLNFDDGLKECHSVIAPILKRKGIPATFFVSPDFIDNKALFHRFKRAILQSRGILPANTKSFYLHEVHELDQLALEHHIRFSDFQPYLNKAELQALHIDGFTIGAHSLNHPEMWLLSEDEQYRQIAESMQWVTGRFEQNIRVFSFPFTDDGLKASLFHRLKANNVLDYTFGTAGLKFDEFPFHLQRIPVEQHRHWDLKKVMHFEYFYFKIRNLFSANTVKRSH